MGTLEKPKSQSPLDSGPIKSPVKSEPILLHVEFSVSAQPKTQYLCTPTKYNLPLFSNLLEPNQSQLHFDHFPLNSQHDDLSLIILNLKLRILKRNCSKTNLPKMSKISSNLFNFFVSTFSWASEILNGPLNTPNELDLPLFNTPNESDFSLSNIPNESDFPPLNASNGPTLADFNDFHEPFFEDY